LARKEAFLAISNLNAAFQNPRSKIETKEFQLIYETLNQTMISAIASIGNFISNHQTPASTEFNVLIKRFPIPYKCHWIV
jgi:hypothetical protein